MKFNKLQTIGLTSALLLTTISGTIIAPSAQANSFQESSQLVAVKTNSVSRFVSAGGHNTTGGAKIINENGQKYIEFDRAFVTDRGPALEVVLHRNSSVGSSLKEGDYITLGRLNSVRGRQRYRIPNDLNLDEYNSVAIWCERFNVTFGYAQL